MVIAEEWKTEPENTDNNEDDSTDANMPRWIHDKVENSAYFGGIQRLPSCVCSNCGFHANRERPVCPRCGSKMRG